MRWQHRQLAAGGWDKLALVEQMANVGSEVERAISWRKKENVEYSRMAFFRALELLDLTIGCDNNKGRLKELTRVRETLADYFAGDNQFVSSDKLWRRYFNAFGYCARVNSK